MKLGVLFALPFVALVGCSKGGGGNSLVDSNGACTGTYRDAYNKVSESARDVKRKADTYDRTGTDLGLEDSLRSLNNQCAQFRALPATSCLATDLNSGTTVTAASSDHERLCQAASDAVKKIDNAKNQAANRAPAPAPKVTAPVANAPGSIARVGDDELVSSLNGKLRVKVLSESNVNAITHDSNSTPNGDTLVAVNGVVTRLGNAVPSINAGKAACWVTNSNGKQLTDVQSVIMVSDQQSGSTRIVGLAVSQDLVVMCLKSAGSLQFTMGEIRDALEGIIEVTAQQ